MGPANERPLHPYLPTCLPTRAISRDFSLVSGLLTKCSLRVTDPKATVSINFISSTSFDLSFGAQRAMAVLNHPRSSNRKSTPLSPPKVPDAPTAPDASKQNKRSTRSASRDFNTAKQPQPNVDPVLPSLQEDVEVFPEQTGDGDGEGEGDEVSSVRGASSTGSSLEELLDALDRDAIIDNLQNLYTDAVNLISLFKDVDEQVLIDICDSTAQSDTRLKKRFDNQMNRLLNTKEDYGMKYYRDQNLDFIKLDPILCKILNLHEFQDMPMGPWRPDPVLHLANLALQIVKVLSSDHQERLNYQDDMLNSFPEQFINFEFFVPEMETWQTMYDLHVEIFTQVFIYTVDARRNEADFDPDQVLVQVLLDGEGKIKGSSDPYGKSKAVERSESIRSYFDTKPGSFIDFEGLKEHFPWSTLAVRAVRWSVNLQEELVKFVESKGGIERLTDLLLGGNFEDEAVQEQQSTSDSNRIHPRQQSARHGFDAVSHDDQEDIDAATTLLARNRSLQTESESLPDQDQPRVVNSTAARSKLRAPVDALRGANLKDDVNQLKAAKAKYAAAASDITSEGTAEEDSQPGPQIRSQTLSMHDHVSGTRISKGRQRFENDDQAVDNAKDDEEEEEMLAIQQQNQVMETILRQQQASDKENAGGRGRAAKKPSFLDRQEGAEKVTWDPEYPEDDEPDQPTRRSPKRSRRRVPADEDEEDEDFETDSRAAKRPRVNAQSRRIPITATRRLPDVEENLEEPDGDIDDEADRDVRPQSLASRPLQDPRNTTTRGPTVFQGRRPPALPASSQPEPLNRERNSANRAPLQPIPSGSQRVPSSSAPVRSNQATLGSSGRLLPPSTQQQPPRAESVQPRQSEVPASTQAQEANREAKERVRMARDLMQNRRPVQNRVAYSVDEVERLMEMIALYGTQWSRILREDNSHEDGPMLQNRSQVQLKDKARNMKLDWLK